MLTHNKIACFFTVALLTFVLLSQHSSVVNAATTSTISGSSLRDWLDSLKSEASTLQGKSNQLERTVALLMESNSTIVQTRISQLSKIKNALNMLNVEIQVINQACSTKGGPDCNITCLKGLNGTECATITSLCNSKCLNCSSSGNCLSCSGNWNGTTCSVCKTGWTGSNCTLAVVVPCDSKCLSCSSSGNCLSCSGNWDGATCSVCKTGWTGSACTLAVVDTGDLVTSSILDSAMATRFVTDIISGVKTKDIKLIFRYSRDGIPCTGTGNSPFALASQVNGKGPTVLIIKATTGAIFGGYASQSWTSLNGPLNDPSTFIFSIQSSTGDQRFTKLLPLVLGRIYDTSPDVVGFGGGMDLSCGCYAGALSGRTYPLTFPNLGQYYFTGSGIPFTTTGSWYTPLDFELYTL